MNLSKVVSRLLKRHSPDRIRKGTSVTLVVQDECPAPNSTWKVVKVEEKKIIVGEAEPRVEVFLLRNKWGAEIEATPYPVPYENQFVKWTARKERREANRQQRQAEELAVCDSEMESLRKRFDEVIRCKEKQASKPKVVKSFEEIQL